MADDGVVASIDDFTEKHGRPPEIGFEVLLRDAGSHGVSLPASRARPISVIWQF